MSPLPLVFILDWEPRSRESLRLFCELGGCRTRTFGRAVELLLALGEATPDLILIEIGQHDIDGLSLCRAIKGHPVTRGLPVVLMSRETQAEAVEAAQHAGACGFLAKPFELWQLRELVARHASREQLDGSVSVVASASA
jgi:CheY-like chemotaxis protein